MIKNKVLKATFWYAVSAFLLKGLSFITTPIFSRILTKAEFGAFANYLAWYQIMSIIVTLSLSASLTRGRFDYEKELDSFVASNLILGSIATFASFFVIIINYDFFLSKFALGKKYIFIMFLSLSVSPAYNMFMEIQRFLYKYKIVAILSTLISICSIVLSLILIFVMEDHLLARTLAHMIPNFLVSIFIYIYYLLHCKKLKLEYWRYSFFICIPYIFHLISVNILNQSDRTMIASFCGMEDTALYSLAHNIGAIVIIFWSVMNDSFSPWLGEKLITQNYVSIKKYTYGYVGFFTFLITLLMLIAPEALLVLGGKQYLESKYVIPPVMASCYFLFIYSMYVNVEQFEKKTKPMAIATFFVALINILTNWIFIPIFGYIAAAYTTLFCYMLLWLFHYFLVKRMKLSLIYDTKYIFLISCGVLVFMFISLYLYKIKMFMRYSVLIIYGVILLWLGIKNKEKIILYFGLNHND